MTPTKKKKKIITKANQNFIYHFFFINSLPPQTSNYIKPKKTNPCPFSTAGFVLSTPSVPKTISSYPFPSSPLLPFSYTAHIINENSHILVSMKF